MKPPVANEAVVGNNAQVEDEEDFTENKVVVGNVPVLPTSVAGIYKMKKSNFIY